MSKSIGVSIAVGAALAPSFANVFGTIDQKIAAKSSKLQALEKRARVSGAADALQKRTMEIQRRYAAGGGKDAVLGAELQKTIGKYRIAQAEAAKYGVRVGQYAGVHAKATAEIAKTATALDRLNRSKALGEKRRELRGRMMDSIGPALAVAAPVKLAVDFESGMADAAKTIDGMRDEAGNLTPAFYEMQEAVKSMGRELPLTHKELASLFAAGGQQGMTSVDELKEFTTMAAQMSVAFGMSTEEAADAIGGYRSAMNLTMPEARSLLDLMNQFANTTSASEKGIADIVRRIGPLGQVGGVAAKPMTALAATLDAMKVAPEVASTGIKNLVLAMTSGAAATKAQKKAFAQIGIKNTAALAEAMQKDGPKAIIGVLEEVNKLPKAKRLSVMQEIFGKESLAAITPLLANLETVKKNLLTTADAAAYEGAMQKEFENRSRTTANALILMSNRVRELGINLGSALLPPLNSLLGVIGPIVSGIAEFAQKNRTLTGIVVGVTAGLVGMKVAMLAAAYGGTFLGGGVLGAAKILGVFVPAMATATSVSQVLAVALKGIGAAMKFAFGPWGLIIGVATLAFGYLWEKFEWFREGVTSLWEGLASVPGLLAEAFGEAIGNMTESIKEFFSGIPILGDAFRGLGKFFGGAGDKLEVKPKAAQAAAVKSIGASVAAAPVVGKSGRPPSSPETQAAPADQAVAAAPQGERAGQPVAPGVQANFSFSINGAPDEEFARGVINALKRRRSDFEGLVSSVVHDQMRVAYGS